MSRGTSIVDVVARLGAMQAQDYAGMTWSVGLRVAGATITDVERAIDAREIVRSWPIRGTLHVVAGRDLRWMLELVGPRTLERTERRAAALALDPPAIDDARAVLKAALADGPRSRPAVMAALEAAKISTKGQRGYHILFRLALEGTLCFATHEGRQPTFALVDTWLPKTKPRSRGAALTELAKRYFTSHGPVTIADFVGWTGLTTADARAGLEGAASALEEVSVDGTRAWQSREAPDGERPREAHLLPGFDEYVLGYKDRSAILDDAHFDAIVPGGNGVFRATILVDGRVAGTWSATATKKKVTIHLEPFTKLKKADVALVERAAADYGRFLGLPASIA